MDLTIKRKLSASNVLENKKIKTYNIPEQDYINCSSIPSLESMAVINVAVGLCMQSDTRDRLRQHSLEFDPVVEGTLRKRRGTFHDESFNQIENDIINKLTFLPLPKMLKAKVSNTIGPIQYQILKWMCCDSKDIDYIDSICWTTEGTIDKLKTLKKLIDKDTGQYIHSNFKLACTYCLEESIPNLWDKLPEKTKKDYLYGKSLYREYRNHLIAYWVNSINNQLSGLIAKLKRRDHKNIYNCNHSLFKNMFTIALSEGESLAVKHFWNKLTDAEICNNMQLWIYDVLRIMKVYGGYQHTNAYADILYFLLNKLDDKEKQMEVLKRNCDVIINALFNDWPWQRHFIPTIHLMWEFIDEQVYVPLLSRIAREIKENKTTAMLLRELWYDSPIDLRTRFIQHMVDAYGGADILCNLLAVEDLGTINALLNDANIEEKKKIIFKLVEGFKVRLVIYAEKLSILNKMLLEVLPESDINRIKEIIVLEHGNTLCHDWISNNNWNMVENFFTWAFTTENQIDRFKSEKMNKIDITETLIRRSNYELVDKFMDWCFESEQEVNGFKKHFSESRPGIVRIGYTEFCALEKFTDWCFNSEQDINDFKSRVLRSPQMRYEIFSSIAFGYDFEFADRLIGWCCRSIEEIKPYKEQFVFSREWMNLLQRFVSNYKNDSEWNNWELLKKLLKLFPLEDHFILDLKEKISTDITFDDFRPGYKIRSYAIKKKDLFRLMDNDSYSIGDDGSNSDTENDSDGDD